MSRPKHSAAERERLAARIEDHLRRYGAETSRVIDVFAQTHDMHRSDMQALVLVLNAERQGEPATPGMLGSALGLTSGAVTGVVDRLVALGHVRREPDPADRRKVRLHYADAGMALAVQFFGPLGARTGAIVADHTVAELRIVERFLERVAAATGEYRATLEATTPP